MSSSAKYAAWVALVDVYQAVLHDTVAVLEGEAGIDSGTFSALAYLERSEPPGTLPLARLQALMYPRYTQPGFSRLVQRMERDGFVERSRSSSDGRAATIAATAAGRRRYRKAEALYLSAVEEVFGQHLGTADARQLRRALEQVLSRRGKSGEEKSGPG